MREIKFRIWNSDLGYMREFEPFNLRQEYYCWYNNDAISQYTGLKDRNGVEIYEGDIVRMKFYDEGYEDGKYCYDEIVYNINGAQFCIGDIDPIPTYLHDDLIVVGNIYENPDLLKQ